MCGVSGVERVDCRCASIQKEEEEENKELCVCWKGECIMIVVCNRVACRAPLIGMSREN